MKKLLTSTIIIISFVIYTFLHNKTDEIIVPPVNSSSSSRTDTSSETDASSNDTNFVSPSTTIGLYKDGEYTGSVADAYYGNIQVKAIIQNGKLTDVEFLQYPNDHHESVEINERAMPILKEEAIQAQSAEVDTVTRATFTTKAFKQSLAAALAEAES